MSISHTREKDGRIVKFDPKKTCNVIHKALLAVNVNDDELFERFWAQIVAIADEGSKDKVLNVDNMQNIAEFFPPRMGELTSKLNM